MLKIVQKNTKFDEKEINSIQRHADELLQKSSENRL